MDLDRRIRHLDLGQACASDLLAIQHSMLRYVISRFTVNSAHHASGVVKAIGSFLFGVDVRFEEQDVQGGFSEATYIFLLVNDFMDFHAGFSFMYPHVPKIAPYCPTPSDILELSQGFSNGRAKAWRMAWEPLPGGDLQKATISAWQGGSLNTYYHYRIRITIWVFPKIGVPPKHPKMIIFSRKSHGCWVPPFLETPI